MRLGLRDTASMETAQKIASESELRAIANAGAGFVVDPFNRRWHVAACARILEMTVGEPKWFAPNRAALDVYLRQRLARYPTARPILACRTCGGSAPSPPERGAVAGPQPRPPLLRRTGSGFEIWADEYVRNESTAGSSAGLLRRLIADEVRALRGLAGRVLHAGYAGQRGRGTDVENLLFNNIDQSLSLFSAAGRLGVRFEDLGLIAPPAPGLTRRRSFYSYRLAEPQEPFTTVTAGPVICRVPEAIVPDGPARLAARIWLAVRRARPPGGPGTPPGDGDFLLRIAVHGLHPATSIKAIVDGATAAMQRDDPDRVTDAITRMAALLGAGAEELLTLATSGDAPLGSRSRSNPTSKEGLFTLDGADQVRITPDDDRCVAAEVVAAFGHGLPRLAVEVHSAQRQLLSPRRALYAGAGLGVDQERLADLLGRQTAQPSQDQGHVRLAVQAGVANREHHRQLAGALGGRGQCRLDRGCAGPPGRRRRPRRGRGW